MKNYIDVAIIGAGISGISAATYLKNKCPNKNFTIFEKIIDYEKNFFYLLNVNFYI